MAAPRLAFLSGAGMSAESGIPTFRDAMSGLWSRFDPEQLATEAAFRRDPALVWGWYRWRAAQVRAASPNAGHHAIATLSRTHAVSVVTQNVDDLHERAGSHDAIHLHGSLFASRCLDCSQRPAAEPIIGGSEASTTEGSHEAPPSCDACNGMIRPGVVWFGEALPEDAWEAAVVAVEACDLLVVVGTSGLVHPAAALPLLARRRGARVLEINPVESAVSRVAHECLRQPASTGMEVLRRRLG